MTLSIKLPDEVEYIISTLEENGHSAHAVGGCVRDSLLGVDPKDWDICTSALPEQTLKLFERHTTLKTGLKHGTVAVLISRKPFEITTYRVDGMYTDNRRPDRVEFVKNLKEDLSRRDFTINAMAYNPMDGLTDFFGGVEDLRAKLVRCVGNTRQRFNEDALRIIRALRFASVLSFTIEDGTAAAIHTSAELLKNIATERVAAELDKLIAGDNAATVLREYAQIMAEYIPEIKPDTKAIGRLLRKIGENKLRLLIEIKNSGDDVNTLLDDLLEKQRFALKDIAINGNDLLKMGVSEGVEVGAILNRLHKMVADGKIENNKDALITAAKAF